METSAQVRLPTITGKPVALSAFPPQHKAALEELKVMNVFNIWIFMTKSLKRKESQKVSLQKLILELT